MANVDALRIQFNCENVFYANPLGTIFHIYIRQTDIGSSSYVTFADFYIRPYQIEGGVVYVPFPVLTNTNNTSYLVVLAETAYAYTRSSFKIDYIDKISIDEQQILVPDATINYQVSRLNGSSSSYNTQSKTVANMLNTELLYSGYQYKGFSSSGYSAMHYNITGIPNLTTVDDKGTSYYGTVTKRTRLRIQFNKDNNIIQAGSDAPYFYIHVRWKDYTSGSEKNHIRVRYTVPISLLTSGVLYLPPNFEATSTYSYPDRIVYFEFSGARISTESELKIDYLDKVEVGPDEVITTLNTLSTSSIYNTTGTFGANAVTAGATLKTALDIIDKDLVNDCEVTGNTKYWLLSRVGMDVVPDKGPAYYEEPIRTITNNLTNCSTNNITTEIKQGRTYNATLTVTDGFKFDVSDVSVMMGSTIITPTISSDTFTCDINIPAPITGDITITATGSARTFNVTTSITNGTSDNPATSVLSTSNYEATITATGNNKFKPSDVLVTVGNVVITPTFIFDYRAFTVSIPAVITGNISISAVALEYCFISNLLTRCTNSNSATELIAGNSYSATVTAETNYYFNVLEGDVSVKMGETVITPTFAQNNKSFTINIANVTDDISIIAKAIWELPEPTEWSAGWVEIDTDTKRNYNVVSSSIHQTAESINLKVSKGDVSSQLSIETDQIVLESGRLIIETGNFQIDENGYITATGAILQNAQIVSEATSGYGITIDDGVIIFHRNDTEGARLEYLTKYSSNTPYFYIKGENDIDILAERDLSLHGDRGLSLQADTALSIGAPEIIIQSEEATQGYVIGVSYLFSDDNGPITALEWNWDYNTGCINYFDITGRTSCFQ